MIQKILGTAGSRILHALLNFVVLMIITQNLGDEGTGLLGLIVLNVTVIMLLTDFICGSSLIYFASRKNIYSLLLTSWFWLLMSVLFFSGLEYILQFFPKLYSWAIPDGYWPYILGLAIIMSLNYINYNLLIGKEMIKEYNMVFSLHIILLVSILAFLVEIVGYEDIKAFVFAEYISFGICYLLSWHYIRPLLKDKQKPNMLPLIKEIISYGSYGQGANLITMINKRLSFYVINGNLGIGPLGIYNAGVQLTEGLRLIGTSISTVQFARVSNQKDPEYAKSLSIQLLKFTVAITAVGVICLMLIPPNWFVTLFGEKFGEIRPVIFSLSIGVVALSGSMILSHYFSGMGMPKYNMWSSSFGAIFTFALIFYLIPKYGYVGAGLTTSAAYLSMFMYQLVIFIRKSGAKMNEFLITKTDFQKFYTELKLLAAKLNN